jgi:SEC-C motif
MSSHAGAGPRKADERLLDRHLAALLETHPWLELEWHRRNTARIGGPLPMELPDGRIEPVVLAVELSAVGGQVDPVAFDPEGRWPSDPDRHVGNEQAFCLGLRKVDEPVIRKPEDLMTWMADLIVFVRQQLVMEGTPGGFPGPEWPHGERQAYALHIVEQLAVVRAEARATHWDHLRGAIPWPPRNDPCSCGSGRKFKKCCLTAAAPELMRIAREPDLRFLAYDDLLELVRADAA